MSANDSSFPPKPEQRSPFPHRSLPQPGESSSEALADLFFDRFFYWLIGAVAFGSIAFIRWLEIYFSVGSSQWMWTGITLFFGGMAARRWFQIKPLVANLRLGIRGEREVGRMLERLRRQGYEVFHDIPGNGFNVDHALIGPGGVFAIETKTRSLPPAGQANLDYDGTRVLLNGRAPDRDPLAQAEGNARHVRDILQRKTGRTIDVRPVVIYPGWFVNGDNAGRRVWVFNEKTFLPWMKREHTRFSREDIALFSDGLTVHLSAD